MRFGVQVLPREGDMRDRTGFLLFPKSVYWKDVSGKWHAETRWLERASWREKFTLGKARDFWLPFRWNDEIL